MTRPHGFIETHGLWNEEQRRAAADLVRRLDAGGVKLVRVAWADTHGVSRAKTLTVPAFLAALRSGHTTTVATSTLDASGARVFASFTPGGGMGLAEMTGSPNIVLVPDPLSFRMLPWEPEIGWVLCDEFFASGAPFPFSTRGLLRRQVQKLETRGLRSVVGLEIEWYLRGLVETRLGDVHVGLPGRKGRAVSTYPVEPGYAFHSETNLDAIQPVVSALADAYERLNLPVRSIEKEFGPGQMECTFAPCDALEAADAVILFRTATRQLCRRLGYFATFMCRPKLYGTYSSGWHLHQSLQNKESGENLFMPADGESPLSASGLHYLGGLLQHGVATCVFANPTVNAYRRFRANSLAPDRLAWGADHRGAMLRVLGASGDGASRIENRLGEPAANPYLYMASQIASGLDGIEHARDPGRPETDPYRSERPALPKSLGAALAALEEDALFRQEWGEVFVDYYLAVKRTEVSRFETWLAAASEPPAPDETTDWEQDEYFDFF